MLRISQDRTFFYKELLWEENEKSKKNRLQQAVANMDRGTRINNYGNRKLVFVHVVSLYLFESPIHIGICSNLPQRYQDSDNNAFYRAKR